MQFGASINIPTYTIIKTGADADRACFPDPEVKGCYLSLACARAEFARLVDAEKQALDERYNSIDDGEDYWEAYQDGYASLCFSRIDLLTSELCCSAADAVSVKCPPDHTKEDAI